MTNEIRDLSRIPIFSTLNADVVANLNRQCAWRQVLARQWVLDYEGGGTDLYFVLRGHLRVIIPASNRELILDDVRTGEFFGELAAIDQEPRSAGILAITDTLLASMPSKLFMQVVDNHPDVRHRLLKKLVVQVRILAERAHNHLIYNIRQRLYAELLRLARDPGDGTARSVISPPPTHAELASRVSAPREAVTRELNALERRSLIERRRGAIVLLDIDRLQDLLLAEGS